MIQKENIEYEYLSLLTIGEIPEDAKAIIINAPITDFSSDDADKVIAYLENGGNAIIVPTWTNEEMSNFERILDYYGISMVNGMIAEGDMGMYYAEDPFMLFPQIYYNEITDSIYGAVVLAPYAQGLEYDDEAEDIYYQPLLETSDSSYSKTYENEEISMEVYKSEEDIDGPFVIAVKTEKTIGNEMISKAVFAASENMFSEAADSIVSGNNIKLFSSILSSRVVH